MITSEDAIKNELLQWAQSGDLRNASLSADGQTLSLGDHTIAARTPITIQHDGKECQYPVASIYLQIVEPDQALMAYRNACKQYQTDPVKALDKPTIVGFFLMDHSAPAAAAAAVAPPVAPTEAAPRDEEKERKRKERHESHRKREKESSSSKRSKHKESKKHKGPMTNEQLISNLDVVVDKRVGDVPTTTQEEIEKALSTQGFQVTPELVEESRAATEAILAQEIPVDTSGSILRATNPKKDLSRVIEIYKESVKPTQKSSQVAAAAKKKSQRAYLIGKKPVIVVPKGMTAPVTLLNAHEFFCNGRFIPRDVMIKQGQKRSNPATTFTRSVRGVGGMTGLLEYEIVDNPKKLGANMKEWERIVAVVVLGQPWQFKDWPPGYNDPVHLFARTYGFFVSMEGDKLPQDIQGWAVRQAKLNRDKRGLDSVTYASFWNGLDEWMAVHRSELLPQQET